MDAKLKSILFAVLLIFVLTGCQAQTAIPISTQTTLPPVTFIPTVTATGTPTNTATAIPANTPTATAGVRISKPGEYLGYSKPIYSDYVKTSQYIPVRDGTKLAANIYRPAQDGKPIDTPLPVIWALSRYYRIILEEALPWYKDMVNYGYVLAIVEIRGTNASFGSYQGVTSESRRAGCL